ncbi:MAG: CxxC-x17-CxxC domain-containing protein [Candidatus Omnitrophota bacterium]|jgi:CxxC-x17-CxxC domain-containing protein
MKKKSKSDTEVLEFIAKIHQQLALLDKKVDALIAKIVTTPKPIEVAKPFIPPKPFQQQSNAHAQAQRQNDRFRERIMHKAICADCRKPCEVPFRPSGDRPVYCQECFSRRKTPNPFKPNINNSSKQIAPVQTAPIDRLQATDKKKSAANKKPVSKKPKKGK